MKTVSSEYAESMSSPMRNRSYVQIKFYNVDADAVDDGSWISNGELDYSEKTTLDYYDYTYGQPIQTLELNRWILDGKGTILPANHTAIDGYVSDKISGADGAFATAPTLIREFSSAKNLLGLTITFSSIREEWPTSVTLKLYNGNSVVYNETKAITENNIVIETETLSITKIELIFNSALPYRRAHLQRVMYGIETIFENDDIQESSQAHDLDPLSRRLPDERFSFKAFDYDRLYDRENPQGIYEFIDVNAPISISYGYELDNGEIEWVYPDKYMLTGKPEIDKDIVTFSGVGLFSTMNGTFYKCPTGEKTLYSLALAVLQDAGLQKTPSGEDPWIIDESLQDIATDGILPITTHAECLQLIAHAGRCRIYTSDDNVIHIEPFNVSELERDGDFEIDFSNEIEYAPKLSVLDTLKSVTIKQYSYEPETYYDDEMQTLKERRILLAKAAPWGATNIHTDFSQIAQNVSIRCNNGSVVSSSVYAGAADIVVTSGTTSVRVYGQPLVESTADIVYNISSKGEEDTEDNPLITSDAMVEALANHVSAYLQKQNTYDIDYRGNPELETGDVISIETRNEDMINALVLTDEITFNGALHGKLKLKGLT